MKRVLITGANSFIGKNLSNYLLTYNSRQGKEEYHVDLISQRDSMWETFSLQGYDVVFQASGIAHVDITKVGEEAQKEYYAVNCDLAVATLKKAQAAGVKQFIYPSSVIIFGDSAPFGKKKNITKDSLTENSNFYADSKIRAEQELQACMGDEAKESALAGEETVGQEPDKGSDSTKLAILRLPMVYGEGSKGNYPLLSKIAHKTPIFPDVHNERSMIYIENLCECIRLLIEEEACGIIYPQNTDYVTTAQMVKTIAEVNGKPMRLWKVLNPCVKLASGMPGKIGKMADKAFGSLTIDQSLSPDRERYNLVDFKESVRRTEKFIENHNC